MGGWHQDNAYFLVRQPHFSTALWIPIHKAIKQNGTLRVVKGFARAADSENGTALAHRRDETSDHHITCKDIIDNIDSQRVLDIEVDEGGVAMFNGNVPHSTGPNQTDSPRAAVAFHFMNMHHFRERQFPLPEGAEYVTPIVSGPDATYGRAEYGYEVGHQQWMRDMEAILREEEQIMECEERQTQTEVRRVSQDKRAETCRILYPT